MVDVFTIYLAMQAYVCIVESQQIGKQVDEQEREVAMERRVADGGRVEEGNNFLYH